MALIKKYWPFVVAVLFALAIAIGLIQNNKDPYANRVSIYQPKTDTSLEEYFKKAQVLAGEKQAPNSTATFLAAGDIMLSRNVAAEIKKTNNPLLPFSQMADILKSTEFNFANLESPLVEKNPIIGGHSMIFSAPSSSALSLAAYNFKILNLANNHAMDQGLNGLNLTSNALALLGIKHIGTGNNLDEAWKPAIVEVNGIKIGFVGASYSSINDSGKAKNNFVARIYDLEHLKSSILYLKSNSDFVVATMHAGTEYTRKPNKSQTDFARAAIDFGADIIIGAHPHWVQTIEKYCPNVPPPLPLGEDAPMQRGAGEGLQNCTNPKYIFYSLGNFIFDQMWSQETKEGLTLKIQVSKNGEPRLQGPKNSAKLDSIELIPIIIENYSTPRPANEQETKKILGKIGIADKMLY